MAIGIKMPRIPRVTTKARNIARSFGYATMDVLWQYNPTIANLHQETKRTFTEAKTSMKSMSGNATKTAKEFLDTKNESALTNLIKDFKSGNWYNKRSEYDDENMGDNVEDWGDESKDSSSSDSDSSIFSTKAVLDSMGDLSTNLSNNFGMASIKTAQYIAETNAAGQQANYELTAKGFSSISNILLNINQKLDVIAESTRVNVVSFQNQNQFYTTTTRFFEDTTKSLGNINASLERIAANTDVFNSTPGGKNKKGRTIDTLLFGDEFSFGAYIDVIKENVKEQTELYRSMLGLGLDVAGKGGKNLSPMSMILTAAIDAAVPKILKKSMETLNKTISHSMVAGLEMISQSLGNSYGIGNIIRQMFLPDTLIGQASKEVKFNRSNYNKGPVQWDGIARKSLVEVIPTYLAKINAALGGQERYYDYELGKFVSVGEIKNKMPAMREAAAHRAGGKFRNDVLESTDNERIKAEVEAYFKAAFEHGTDFNNVKERSKDAAWLEKMGLSKESAKVISDVVDRYADNKDSSRLIKFMSAVAIERNKYKDDIKKEETQGYSTLSNLENGFVESFKSSTAVMNNIYQVVGNIYALLSTGGVGGGGRKRKKSTINRPMFDVKTGKIISSAEYEQQQKKRDEAEEDGKQTKKEKPVNEEKEAKKNFEAAQDQFKGFINKVTNKIDEHDKKGHRKKASEAIHKFFDKIGGWYRAPFEQMANVINSFSEGVSQLFWGTNDGDGLIDKISEKVTSVFDEMKNKLSDKWKDILNHFGNLTGIIPAIKDQAKSIFEGAKGRVKDFVFGKRSAKKNAYNYAATGEGDRFAAEKYFSSKYKKKHVKKADQATTENVDIDGGAAYGRGITRGGLVAVSKGELIIPSEMNPFYNGTTNKAAQIQKENNVINKYGGGIKGYAKGNFDFDGGLIGFFKNMFGQAKKGVGKAFDFFTDGSTKIEESKKKIEENIAKIMAEVDDKKGAVGLGALTGAGLSIIGTVTLGPLASAAIGGGLGLLYKSKQVQEMLFGQKKDETDEEYEASMRARIKKLFDENLQEMGYGAAIGAIGGALMGSPVLGAIAGASIGYIKSSKTAQEALFGKVNEKGEHTKYLGQLLDKMKQRLPKIGIGAGLGALIGLSTPLGLAGSIIVGAAGGFISDEQQFKDYMFGKRDKDGKVSKEEEENSFMGIIKHKIIYNIDDLHHNATNFLRGFGKVLRIKAYKLFDSLGRKFTRFLRTFGKVSNSVLQKVLGFGLSTVGGVAKTALKGVGGALGVANRGLQNVNLRYGFNVYDRSQKRNLSAKERNEIRERNKLTYTDNETGETKGVGKYSTGYAIDKGIGNANDEQLLQLEDFVKGMSSSNTRNLTIRDNILKNAMHELNSDKFANLYLDRERSSAVDDLIRKGDIDKAMGILKKNGLKESEIEQARKILESSHKEIKESENAKNVDDAALKILSEQFGMTIDPKKKEEAMATMLDLIKTEKDFRGINGDEKKIKEVAEQERNEDDFKASGLGLLESIYEVASYMAGLKTKEGIIRGKWKSYVTRNMLGDMIKNGEITNKEEAEEAIKNTEGFDKEAYDIGQVAKERAIEGDEIEKRNVLTGKKEKKIVSAKGDLVKRSFNSKKKNNAFKFANMGEGDREEAEKYFRERYNRKHKKRSTDFTPAEDAADEAAGEQKSKEKFKTVFDMFSKPHKYRQKDDGEWEEVKNDSGTDDSRSTMDKFTNSIGKIPVIGGLLTKMGGIFSALKDGLLGNKKEKKKGIFDHLFDFLSGKADGVVKSALQFFTNNPVTGALSTMFKGLNFSTLLSTVVGPVLFGAAISGKFDKAFANLASILGLNGNETEDNSQFDDNRKEIYRDEKGNPIILKPGEPIPDNATTEVVGSDDSLSSHLKLNFLRGIMTGKGSIVATIGKGVFNNFRNGLKTMAGSGNKIAEKLSGMIDDAGAAIAKKGVIPALATGVSKSIATVFEKIPQVLKAIPFMPASVVDKADEICIALFTHIDDAIMKAGTKLQKVATAIGKAMPFINLAWVITRCINAWGDAESILGITDEATTMQRVVAVFVAFCNTQIPLFADLIPDKVFVNIIIGVLDKLGFDMSDIQEQREKAKAEVEKYNAENGTDFTIEQYNQAVKNRGGVFTKLKNGVGGYIKDIKRQGIVKATSNRFEQLKNKVVAGAEAVGEKAKEIGGFVKDKAIELGNKINDNFGIIDLLKYVKDGDIKGFLTYQPNTIDDDDNPLMKVAKNIPTTLVKHALFGPAMISAVGHGLINGIKKLIENIKGGFEAVKSEFTDAVSMMRDAKIDTMGELLTVKYDNPDNPLNGIQKAILTVSRIAGIGFSLFAAVGKKIKEAIVDPVIDGVKNIFNTFTGDVGNIINIIKEGKSPLDLINYESTGLEQNPIFGTIMTAALDIPKLVGFIPSVISWVGHGIGKVIGETVDKFKSAGSAMTEQIAAMKTFSTAGDVKGLLGYDISKNDNGDEASFLQQVVGGTSKIALLFPTGIKWVGNRVSELWTKFTTPITNDANLLKDGIDALNRLGENGDLDGVLKAKYEHKSMFGGIMNIGYSVFKIINFVKAIGNKYGGAIKDFFGGIVDGVKDKIEGVKEKVGGVVQGAKNAIGGVANNVAASAQKFVSGAGSGFVNQYDSGAGAKGCGPAVASMAANSLGKNLSVNSAVSQSNGYKNSAGVDAGYFNKVLGNSGISTNYITGPTKNQQILNSLHSGNKVILLGQRGGYSGGMSKAESPFGPNNHYVLATGYDKNGLIINDPELKGPVRYPWGILNNVKMGISAGASGATIPGVGYVESNGKVLGREETSSNTEEKSMKKASDELKGIDEDTARNVYAFFTEKGYSPAAAAGILGNMYQESKVNPRAIQGGGKGPAAGIVQWESIHDPTSRYGKMKAYAESKGKDWTDLTSQLEFVDQELPGLNSYFQGKGKAAKNLTKADATPTTFEEWKNSKDPIMATNQFEAAFERAGKPGMDPRRNAASVFYNAYSGHTIKYDPSKGGGVGMTSTTDGSNPSNAEMDPETAINTTPNPEELTKDGEGNEKEDKSFFSNGLLGVMGKIAAAFTNAFSKAPNGHASTEDDDEDYGIIQRDENGNIIRSGINGTSTVNGNAIDGSGDSTTPQGKGSIKSVIDIAKSQIGYKEKASKSQLEDPDANVGDGNWTKYGDITGSNGQAWCASFVSWVFDKAFNGNKEARDAALRGGPTAGARQGFGARFKNLNQMYKEPQPGDIINYLDHSHTGIVESVDTTNKTYTSIEGNTSGDNKDNRDGGQVARKVNKSWSKAEFGRPDWNKAAEIFGPVGKTTESSSAGTVKDIAGVGKVASNGKVLGTKGYQTIPGVGVVDKATGMTLSGGDSGLFDNAAVANSNVPDASSIMASIPNIDTSKGIDPQLVNKLIEAFSKLLGSIATNTAPIDKIYQLLASGQINVNATGTSSTEENRTTPESTAVAGKVAAHSNNISEQLINLSGVLAAIAKG